MDTFAGAIDGLGARKWFAEPAWQSIQLDVRDLSPLGTGWDLVIVNRCTQFAADPAGWLRQVQTLVKPGGAALILGLYFFARPGHKRQQVSALGSSFRAATGRDLFLHPTRGWLGLADARAMGQLGIGLRPYPDPRLLAADLMGLVQPDRPRHRWGWWRS